MSAPETRDGKRILVTGASGLLGRSLVARLSESEEVSGAGYSSSAGGFPPVDLRDEMALTQLLRETTPDVVVHAAAYRDPDFCEDHPEEAARLNVDPVRRFSARLPESVPLVFVSSDYVFDGKAPPYREEDEPRPVNVYGKLKVEAEDLVLHRRGGLVLRIPLLIGAGPTGEATGFISKTLAQILDPTPSTFDHSAIRFPTWIDDVAEAVAHLLNIKAKGIYHYSSIEGGTRYEWASELADLAGLTMDHITPNREGATTRAARPGNTQLAVDKIRSSGSERFTPFRAAAQAILNGGPPANTPG